MVENTVKILRSLDARLLPRMRSLYHRRRAAALEREHLAEFQNFYGGLDDKKDIFYVFFSSGLLHWASRILAFAPRDVNVVLLGSCLERSEIEWIRENLSRPFHHVRLRIDDKTAWEFLLETNRHHFGWLDVDCFVLNPRLFEEMARIDDDTAVNCCWSFVAPAGARVLLTYFLFVNVEVFAAVNREVPVSPTTYSYHWRRRHCPFKTYAVCEVPSRRHRRLLRSIFPVQAGNQPIYPRDAHFFDTLQLYQLIANALGYALHAVRNLDLVLPVSEELLHVGQVSYYRVLKESAPVDYQLLSMANYAMLSEMQGQLPQQYSRMRADIHADLAGLGMPTDVDQIKRILCQEMTAAGANEQTISRIVNL